MLHYPPPYDNQNLGNIQYRTKVNNDEEIKLRKTHPLLTSSFEVSRSILDIASPPPCRRQYLTAAPSTRASRIAINTLRSCCVSPFTDFHSR